MKYNAKNAVLCTTATAVASTSTICGSLVDVALYDTCTIWVEYTKGTETGLYIVIKAYRTLGGTAFQLGEWAASSGVYSFTASSWTLTASANVPIVLNVSGIESIEVYQYKTGGTVSGTVGVSYTLTGK